MMQKFSYHTHTNSFGVYDGHNSAAEMIAAAEAAGYTELGISNHLICKKGISRFTPQFFDDFKIAETVYLKTIDEIRTAAQKYKIKVYVGFEVDYFKSAEWRRSFEKLRKRLDVDYLIGSTHCLLNDDAGWVQNIYEMVRKPVYVDEETKREGIKNYWLNVIESIKSGYFNFIAHLDVIKIFGMGLEPEWDEYKWRVIETLSETKLPYELNTSGWNKAGEQHPHTWMLVELSKRNVPVVISDDAHSTAMLAQHFDRAEKLLTELNYTNRWRLNK